jgi:hypothetical protein
MKTVLLSLALMTQLVAHAAAPDRLTNVATASDAASDGASVVAQTKTNRVAPPTRRIDKR